MCALVLLIIEFDTHWLLDKSDIEIQFILIYYISLRSVMVSAVRNGHDKSEFKAWMRLFAFHIALIPLEKIGIQLIILHG